MDRDKFNFENLEVWKKSIDFANKIIVTVDEIKTDRKHYRLIEQIEASSTSIASNIAEGKGRYSKKEFIQFLYISRGSLYETITLLTIFNKNNWIDDKKLQELKLIGIEISKMIVSLIVSIKKSIS